MGPYLFVLKMIVKLFSVVTILRKRFEQLGAVETRPTLPISHDDFVTVNTANSLVFTLEIEQPFKIVYHCSFQNNSPSGEELSFIGFYAYDEACLT
jgi:hypothetical protein